MNLTEENTQLIEEFLQNNDANLSSISICNRKMHSSMERIANALHSNTTVSELYFPHNCITSEEAAHLATALTHQENSAVKQIDLSNPNAMENWFVETSHQNKRNVFSWQFNKIDDAAATALVNAVITKPKFWKLDLRGNCITAACGEELKARMTAARKRFEYEPSVIT